jgi:aconitate hydratase
MNTAYRTPLPGTALDYFDARAAVNAIATNAWDELPYTSRCWPKTSFAAVIRIRSKIRCDS